MRSQFIPFVMELCPAKHFDRCHLKGVQSAKVNPPVISINSVDLCVCDTRAATIVKERE